VKKKKLGEMLTSSGLITESQLLNGLERQKSWGGRLGSNLVMIGALKESELLKFLSAQTGVKEINLSEIEIIPQILNKIPQKVVEQFNLIPVRMKGKSTLVVALADPTDLNAIDQVAFITGNNVEPVITSYSAILHAINKYYLSPQIYNSGNQEIMIGADSNIDMEGFTSDQMENHGGRSAVADPDLILFGDQSESVFPPLEAPLGLDDLPVPDTQPKPIPTELDSDLMGMGNKQTQGAPAGGPVKKVPSNSNLSSFSQEQKLIGLYHVLLKKRLVTETEISEELMRLWAMGKL